MKIAFILGTRPEVIKLSPIINECKAQHIEHFVIHSGQHFSHEMDKIFFDQLDLDPPEYNLNTSKLLNEGVVEKNTQREIFENPDGCIHHGKQLGLMLGKIEEILFKEKPNIVLVQGDTNTTLAGALAAVKLHIDVGHVEAGLRSYDMAMPEEINRILVDRISNYLFCPTELQKNILQSEGIEKHKIFVTGNTIVDVLFHYENLIKGNADSVLTCFDLEPKSYFLLTIHREENVDESDNLKAIVLAIDKIAQELELPVIFPIHPRTELKIFDVIDTGELSIQFVKPLGFVEFISLEKNAKLIITDSGGVQEEACVLKTPCITLRTTTERPETLEVNANILSGLNKNEIMNHIRTMLSRNREWENPFGTGDAAQKILAALKGKEG
ncbi:MAG: UDP-N-acetylglucosamine 2-epimerase (non-hydrolyzing) [Candidatus Aminicenantes bacterium]|nr:UDP-N-acetylglucosamine 2-epimerase (non-hydrolyzing) [Candidatus Aminicenantes bacterium]